MAVLAPFAQFGVLQTLIVPADAAATTANILASAGIFRAAIAAFLIIAILDIVVAWGLYILLRPTNASLALLVAWLRVAYAAVFAYALVNLLDVAQLLQSTSAAALSPVQIQAQVASSIASFNNGWDLALAIFGFHLVGLGVLLFKSVDFPKVLGALVALAGVGYLADSFGTILVPGYTLTISVFTFIGEALLIVWLFKLAIRGSHPSDSPRAIGSPVLATEAVAIMTSLDSGHFLSRVRGGLAMNVPRQSTSTRSPVLAILASLVAGIVLAIALLLGPASGASEPMITGSVMFAFGLGWGLMAFLSTRYSAQPQTWMVVPALFLGIIGLGLMVFQPGPAAMDLLSWIWPPALAILAVWMFMQVRRQPPRPRPLARRPGHRHAPAHRRRWCLRDRQRSHSRNRADRSRPDGRRGRPPALHRMHGLGQPDRRPPGGARRLVLLTGQASRRRSPRRQGSAPTTARATDIATKQPGRRMGSPSQPTCTPCSSGPA